MEVQIVNPVITMDMLNPATSGSAGIDLRLAGLVKSRWLNVDDVFKCSTGIKVAIPEGFVGFLMPRSSTGVNGLHLANSIGVIDSDYRGELMVVLRNVGDRGIQVMPNQRVAQLVVVPHYNYAGTEVVELLDSTDRGEKGFGSTGTG